MSKPLIGLAAMAASNADGNTRVAAVNRAYVDAVIVAGGLPVMLPIQSCADAVDAVASLDALVLCGGVDIDPAAYGAPEGPDIGGVDQERDAWELALLAAARHDGLPVLGVCRGAQILNVSAGGTLVRDVPTATGMNHREAARHRDEIHRVSIEPDSMLAQVCDARSFGVNTLHHQAVDHVGQGMRAVAWAPDSTIEAVESTTDWFAMGVQWHPELLIDEPGDLAARPHLALFSWLVSSAQARRMRIVPGSLPDDVAPIPQPVMVSSAEERQAS
jgi:putative glutamine amidotransferase